MPSNLEQGHTYLRVTTSDPSPSLVGASGSAPASPLITYIGQVGELADEHVYEVKTQDGAAIDPAGAFWTAQGASIVKGLKDQGIRTEVLVHRQRAKRDEF